MCTVAAKSANQMSCWLADPWLHSMGMSVTGFDHIGSTCILLSFIPVWVLTLLAATFSPTLCLSVSHAPAVLAFRLGFGLEHKVRILVGCGSPCLLLHSVLSREI